MLLSAENREHDLKMAESAQFDLVVVGGGSTGAGTARDAALRGMRVLLLERGDLGGQTSSRSSRLIHGGLRYLEQFRLGLVRESVVERWRLLQNASHLVSPLPFLYPVYEGDNPGLWMISVGTALYSMLAGSRSVGERRTLSASEVTREEPSLLADKLVGGCEYYDCSTDDARLTLETAIDAAVAGALVLPYCNVTAGNIDKEGIDFSVTDLLTGSSFTVRGQTAVCAAGPWTDEFLGICSPRQPKWLRPTKGVHLVFSREDLPLGRAVVLKSTQDRRIAFAIPWGTHTYVGTTDTDHPDPSLPATVERADADYLIALANRYFPDSRLGIESVCSVWAGLRPLVTSASSGSDDKLRPSQVSREERIEVVSDRLVVVAGGKLTTYRAMSRKVVDSVVLLLEKSGSGPFARCSTGERPLPGSLEPLGYAATCHQLETLHPTLPADWLHLIVSKYGIAAENVALLAEENRALLEPLPSGLGHRLAEVVHAIRHEYVCTPEDFLMRRTQIYYKGLDQGRSAAPIVSDLIRHNAHLHENLLGSSLEAYLKEVDGWRERLADQIQ